MASGFGFRFGFFSIFFSLGKPQTRPHCFFRWAVQNNCKSFAQAGKLFAAFSISKMSISNENENKKQLPKHLAKLSLTGKCHYTSESLAVGFGWQIVDPGRRTLVIRTSGSLATRGAIFKIWFRSTQKWAVAKRHPHEKWCKDPGSHLHDSNIHHEAKPSTMLRSGLTIYKNWFNQLWNNCSSDTS